MYKLIDHITHHLPETIHINQEKKDSFRYSLLWKKLVNAIVFMFLYLTLYYGYDVFGLKELIKNI